MTDQPVEALTAELTIRLDDSTVTLATVALGGTRPVLLITPTVDAADGVLSFDVDSTGMGDTPAEIAETLELLIHVLKGEQPDTVTIGLEDARAALEDMGTGGANQLLRDAVAAYDADLLDA